MTDQNDDKKPEAAEDAEAKGARGRFLDPVQRKLLQGGIDSLKKNGAAYDLLKNR